MVSNAEYGDIQIDIPEVNHQKQPGRIKLSMTYVLWEPDLLGDKLAVPIESVKNHKISPDGKSKVQIQVITKDGKALSFHFTNNNPPGFAKENRDKVKIHLSRLIGRIPSKKPDKAFEERKKILQENPALLKLYKELVTTKMVLPEEFWSTRMNLLNQSNQQEIGVSGNFLSELKPKSDGSNSIRYNLNDEMKKIIFRTYPAVKSRCLELCPSQMSEKEFWTEFFQSQYFHRDKFETGIFKDCDINEAKDVKAQERSNFLNLNEIFEEGKADEDQIDLNAEKQKVKDKKQKLHLTQKEVNRMLIRRFNQHSSLVLKACERLKRPADQVNCPIKAKKTNEHVMELKSENRDLVGNDTKSDPKINLQNRDLFLNSLKENDDSSLLAKLNDRQRRSCLDKFTRATRDYTTKIDETISCAQNKFPQVLIDLKRDQKKEKMDKEREVPSEIQDAMSECREILSHFWSCFPPKPDTNEKMMRMNSNLLTFDSKKLKDLEMHYDQGSIAHLREMREMIDTAIAKFNAFESRRKR